MNSYISILFQNELKPVRLGEFHQKPGTVLVALEEAGECNSISDEINAYSKAMAFFPFHQ